MEFIEKIKNTIDRHSMLSEGDSVFIGLSGGPDSVCLSIILSQLKDDFRLTLSAVYVDHSLRPDETEDEKAFCKTLCDSLGIEFYTETVDVRGHANEKGLNLQEAARELRYKAYEELAKRINASKIALGHNADDQAETFFMRLLRGSGTKGISGIPPIRSLRVKGQGSKGTLIIRPLIETERSEIEEFICSSLATRYSSQPYMVDSSNLKKDYFRNWLRLTFMGELKKRNPSLVKNICKVTDILREEDAYLENIVTKTLMKLISRKDREMIELFLLPLEGMEMAILRRLIRRAIDAVEGLRGIEFVHIEDIIGLIKIGKSGDRLYLPKGIKAVKGYSTLLLTSKPPLQLPAYDLNVPGELAIKEAHIILKADIVEKADIGYDNKKSALFDLGKLTLPLTVRSRKDGDCFYPSGFGKKKKLQDFFVDNKVPRDERDSIPLLASGEDIIWVIGYRADDRFVAKNHTNRFLLIQVLERKG
ncbi:MAG: tRNA lysidine(34) synthetase TilS [Nitrospirae bacterium]|nr:tRNA lysidine(34) synthetase TilS [Nitrospirota bacterium]